MSLQSKGQEELPLVSIVIPVRNEGHRIQKVIEEAIGQSYRPLEVLILDNGSTDDTLEICLQAADEYPEIRVHAHPQNIGGWPNFLYGLDKSKGEFFCWAAADDSKSPNFVANCVEFLVSNPGYVGVTGLEYFGEVIRRFEIVGDNRPARIREFFDICWEANGLIYGLFRSDNLKQIPIAEGDFFAVDWTTLLWGLTQGKVGRIFGSSIRIGTEGTSNGPNRFSALRTSWRFWFQPFHQLQGEVLSWPDWTEKERLFLKAEFFRKNLQASWWQLKDALRPLRK